MDLGNGPVIRNLNIMISLQGKEDGSDLRFQYEIGDVNGNEIFSGYRSISAKEAGKNRTKYMADLAQKKEMHMVEEGIVAFMENYITTGTPLTEIVLKSGECDLSCDGASDDCDSEESFLSRKQKKALYAPTKGMSGAAAEVGIDGTLREMRRKGEYVSLTKAAAFCGCSAEAFKKYIEEMGGPESYKNKINGFRYYKREDIIEFKKRLIVKKSS